MSQKQPEAHQHLQRKRSQTMRSLFNFFEVSFSSRSCVCNDYGQYHHVMKELTCTSRSRAFQRSCQLCAALRSVFRSAMRASNWVVVFATLARASSACRWASSATTVVVSIVRPSKMIESIAESVSIAALTAALLTAFYYQHVVRKVSTYNQLGEVIFSLY